VIHTIHTTHTPDQLVDDREVDRSILITVHDGFSVMAYDARSNPPRLLLGFDLQDDEHGLPDVQRTVDALLEPVRAQLVSQLVRTAVEVPTVGQQVTLVAWTDPDDPTLSSPRQHAVVLDVTDVRTGSTILVQLHEYDDDDIDDGVREVPLDQLEEIT
jgi:hypothetical protein